MRLNPKFIMRTVANETLLISIEDISAPKRLLMLNELGANIYSLLQKNLSKDEILTQLLSDYEVDISVLEKDVDDFLATLISYGVLMD